MATPKPGEIRCPTCHRSTPPASFCTQCGSAIPSDARIRPRGMDRDELQDRIRARRSGGDPYRRGTVEDERGGYQRFEPDPIDVQARRPHAAGAPPRQDYLADRATDEELGAATAAGGAFGDGDLTRDRDEWARPAAVTPAAAPPVGDPYAPPPSDVPLGDAPAGPEPVYGRGPDDEPAYVDNFDDDAAYDEAGFPYPYEDWSERRERRSGAGAFAILGFLALGVLALLGGAVLAGVLDGDPSGGVADATPTPTATVAPTVAPSPSETPAPTDSAAPDGSPGASGEPIEFPDGFTAEAQPCIRGSVSATGCNSNGASNSGSVDIWVGFTNGTSEDVIGATLVAPDGTTVDGSIDLADIGCRSSCRGYTFFPFDNLDPGTYEVRVTRNGDLASTVTFEVT